MKHIIWITLLLAAVSCKKDDTEEISCTNGILDGTEVQIDCGGDCTPCAIEYPETGTYGVNVLHGNDTIKLSSSGNYSLRAVIPVGSSLKIQFNHVSGSIWGYGISSNIGWSITEYEDGIQIFDALNGGTTELEVDKWSGPDEGVILIQYLENGAVVTKDKILIWE